MEQFKIDLFEKTNKSFFPKFTHLSITDCENIINILKCRYNAKNIDDIVKDQVFCDHINENICFSLTDIANKLKLQIHNEIYINWDAFNDIDVLNLDVLNKYFFDIWYPISDDIDLFDNSFNWILSIRHDGAIYIFKSK